jgi:hypothetical protein
MNLNFELVNNALGNLEKPFLTKKDKEDNGEAWRTAKQYYLQTLLEALAQVEWTSALRRRELAPAQGPANRNRDFRHAYVVPLDCARHVELEGRAYYKVEGGLLYTDASPARLLYVGNGRRPYVPDGEASGGGARRGAANAYLAGGDANSGRRAEEDDQVIYGYARRGPDGSTVGPSPEAAEDFPDYRELSLEPNFYLYWEYLLTARYAMRLTDRPGLADAWLAKAQAIGGMAESVSRGQAAGRRVAPLTWQEQLGIPDPSVYGGAGRGGYDEDPFWRDYDCSHPAR